MKKGGGLGFFSEESLEKLGFLKGKCRNEGKTVMACARKLVGDLIAKEGGEAKQEYWLTENTSRRAKESTTFEASSSAFSHATSEGEKGHRGTGITPSEIGRNLKKVKSR